MENKMEIKCLNCGKVFELSENEQKWYEEKGLCLPKRCSECRKERRERNRRDNA